jgi:hypothetical protein
MNKLQGLLIAGLLSLTSVSFANTEACKIYIDNAELSTVAAEFLSKRNADKDKRGLLKKLTDADKKVDSSKYADAVQKLNDYRDAVISMRDAAKPKMDIDDANGLVAAADDAIDACNL